MASKSMDAQGSSSPPYWKPNWPQPPYSYPSTTSRGSSRGTSNTSGTIYSNNTSSGGFTFTPSTHGLDFSCPDGGEDSEKNLEHTQEFCAAKGDTVSVLKRCLSDIMGASPQIADDPSATSCLLYLAGSWIRALTAITDTFLTDMLSNTTVIEEDRRRHVQHINSARSAETCILKMLPFVDTLVSAPYFSDTSCSEIDDDGAPAPAEKLRPLIGVREAVSRASQDIRLSFCSTSSEEAKSITDKMVSLLLTKEAKLDEAIWNTMDEVRTRLLASTEGSWWGSQVSSPGIHKVTRAITSYINLLTTNCATVHQIVDQAVQLRGHVPKLDSISPSTSLIMETVSCLEEKLAEKSRSFQDQSLRFLFLINNSYFIWQQLYPTTQILESHMSDLARKIDNYIETYLQVSWAPVLSILYYNSTPLCLGRYSSVPAKFEAEFQKTYAAQKLLKVPDPKLRRRLRVAVVEKVISNFTKYLEYNNISTSRITPQDLMDMLQELFEG